MKHHPAASDQKQTPPLQPHHSPLKTGLDFSPPPTPSTFACAFELQWDEIKFFFSQREKLHGQDFSSWWISETCSLGARGAAGLWSLLLRTARALHRAQPAYPPLQSIWVPWVPFSTEAWGVMGSRTMPTRVPTLTLLADWAGAGITAHCVGAGGVPWARHLLCTLVNICQDNATWHQVRYLS